MAIDGAGDAGIFKQLLAVTFGPLGGVPVAVPMFEIEPALRSANVVVYVAVQVSLAQAASDVAGHVIDDRPTIGSETVTGSNFTVPVLVTV